MESSVQRFYSGISGIDLPYPKSQYPPEFQDKTRLQYYASLFNSLEVNSIFYKLPKPSTLAKWAESVPQNFQFTFKLSKCITHAKGLHFDRKDVHDFVRVIEQAGNKKGCILIQFPPSTKVDKLDRLDILLEAMGEAMQNTSWKLAVEFRDPSWYEREVFELLEDYEATMVLHDMAKCATSQLDVWSNFVYLRFHGPEPRYRGDYADEVLKEHALLVHRWLQENKTVYVYFNNTAGCAFKNLQTFNGFVEEMR